ncbi:hypothetical protein Golob_006212 [Gossypium lobatum]|uniref:Zinc knuckle CX2CX4HX4C domain-containing protein n=1 Tax=Gossypium lobatum TaxID=34289 RepID=A0A7J8MVW8_9ROSI|nr:hypothetical protein [Gossypium lobatum]
MVGTDEDEIIWSIKYEQLRTFCYTCGCIGQHTKKYRQANSIKGIDNPKFQYGIGEGQKGVDRRSDSMAQEEGFMIIQKGKENGKTRDEVSDSCSPTSKHTPRIINLGITMIKRKNNKVGNGEGLDESLIRMVIDDAKKCGGRRRPKVAMDNFRIIMDDLALVDVKPDKGWFTWTNNR